MKRIVWDQPERVGRFVCERTGGAYEPNRSAAIGLERDGQLIGGVLFDQYTGRSIAMHVAGEGTHWPSHEFIRACFGYAFVQLQAHKVLGFVDSTNERARRFDENVGFRLEACITGAGEHGDLLIYSMTPDECRWIGAKE